MSSIENQRVPLLPLQPTEEERAIRDAVAKIASKYGPDYWAEKVKAKQPMTELTAELGAAGFLGVHLPEAYGGSGLGIYELTLVLDETARAGCPIAGLVFSAGIAAPILARHGTEAQKAEWIPQLASGQKLFSFAITEPDAGSNTHNIKTSARKQGNKYIINGQKYWTTGLDIADKVLVVARTGTDEATGRGRLSLFLVDADAPGISKTVIPSMMMIPEQSFQVFFDNVEVPEDRLIGGLDNGLKAVFAGLNPERVMAASNIIGIGRYALEKASRYANERSVWGVSIGRHQGVAHALAEAKVQLELAALMTKKAALLHDHGLNAGDEANMAKFAAGEAAVNCIDKAIGVFGGNAVALEYQLMTYWPTVRMTKNGPVSREMILNYVAQNMLGLEKSY
ncbi:acyl-CoA/acyl-ACP dehydrogenase [Pseudomonas putida]|uniref:acyl-CoA dehydrogenase family protein n=1 Tax=Pseudomonas putida TaxID=303 RepID=UPI00236487F0|nr:acyl-CoA dehydrogenase family protein [Pseudomonas putida]MDD2068710.1 acyl-CoA/acyl-ACP dehydrogenase [Pseudomonas putida]HDS1738643.1 acyl-CoA/acyl-ACP dehydrogenase [Pseudomonas putida]